MIFVDSGAFVARYIVKDPYHPASMAIWGELKGTKLYTSNHVLDETFTILARRVGYLFAADRAERIYASSAFDIISSTRDEEIEAIRFFRKLADQSVSFTDCISFAIMKRNWISTAFTFDRHFRDAGFRVLGMK
jgi:predicted nucleic acid-binding protein